MFAVKSSVRIPHTNIRLFKRSVYCDGLETNPTRRCYEWAQLLKEKGPDNNVYRAVSIDLNVGAIWDGGKVKYEDGHSSHWGPMERDGEEHHFGGHLSQELTLPRDVNIKRIEINRGDQGSGVMDGIRMHLSNQRTSAGELNHGDQSSIVRLEPGALEVIVGFYGKSEFGGFNGVMEFGIITAPKNIGLDGLPDATFDLPELKNTNRVIGEEGEDEGDDERSASGSSSDSEDEDSDSRSE